MHVVHLDLERGWRGGERQISLLIREIARGAQIRQTLVCRRGSRFREELAGLTGVAILPVRDRAAAFWHLPRGGTDLIYHAHTGNTVPLAVLLTGSCPAVITRRLDLPVNAWLFRMADKVVAISARVREVLLDAGLGPERLAVIPSGIDRSRRLSPAAGAELRAGIGAGPDSFVGLTVAALVDQKDPLTLVRALPGLPDRYLHVWVGAGDLLPDVVDLADQLEVRDRLLLPGFDPQPDRWFGAADAFVLPSVHEGLGSVLLDAFHFGVPVVASDIPGSAGILEHGRSALLFPVGDAEALADRLRRLFEGADLRSALVDEGLGRVAAFDIRDIASRYLALYRELLGVRESG